MLRRPKRSLKPTPPLAMETSSLSKAFDDTGTMPFRCRTALKDFEKAIADANSAAVSQRAKVAEITKAYLKNAMDKAQAAGDLDKVIAYRKALETADGEITGDDEEIVKLRNSRAAQLEKIDKNFVASCISAADAFRGTLEWQKKETTQKGDIETAQTIAAFVKQVDTWINETRSMMPAPSKAATQTVRRKFVREEKPIKPVAKIITIDAKSNKGTSIGMAKAGDTIEIQYVSGMWKKGPKYRIESPDEEGALKQTLLVNGRDHEYVLARIPRGTKENPFRFSVVEKAEYALRMDDGDHSDNTGSVRYSVKIISGQK